MSITLFFYLLIVIFTVTISVKKVDGKEVRPIIHIITAFLWPLILVGLLWIYIEKD